MTKQKIKLPGKKSLILIGLLGILGASASLFFNLGIKYADVSIVAVLFGANPIIPCLYSAIFEKEKLTKQQYIAISGILLGIILIAL